ncbi:MAG: dihydrofolate reductase [Planctomycetales bacterium]|nr:dihydrofolate reductase [Planctomycetales bacterium]
MRVSIIVAVADNGIIGQNEDLPWRLSSDLKRFKRTTMGHPMIMGRKTYDTIGRPLPGRTSIIVTRNSDFSAEGCLVSNDVEAAIELARGCEHRDAPEVFIIGGRQIYELTLDLADRLHWTQVCASPPGDTYFPNVDWSRWHLVSEEHFDADEKNEFETNYQIYDRTKP